MKFRSDSKSLHRAWIAGCIFAGVLALTGIASWLLDVGFSRGTLVGYGIGAVGVVVFSRGLYHRSIVSGGLLLLAALGPIVRETAQWTMGAAEPEPSVAVLMRAVVALSGLGLSLVVIREMYDLLSEETSAAPRHTSHLP